MAYTGWADLPLDLLDGVIARLLFPGDRARFAAACCGWRNAARELVNHVPWIVLPYGTFCTAGRGAACSAFWIPGFPDDTTCLGAAHDCWIALDRDRRCKDTRQDVVYARPEVNHKHRYMLHNPFSNVTVPLPELDADLGLIPETFEVRKMLMRSSTPDDVIAVTTNSWNCNIILCRPRKGTLVLPYYRVIDVVFVGDILYGITSGEELLAFHLGEDEDCRPNVTRIELVIKNPLAHYYHDYCEWLWPEEVVDTSDKMSSSNRENKDDPDDVDEEEEPCQEENDNDTNEEGNQEEEEEEEDINDNLTDEEENQEEEEEDINEESDVDDLADQALQYGLNVDEMVSDNEVFDGYADGEVFDRFAGPYEAKDELHMGRYLVQSQSGELLLMKHQWQTCPYSSPFTRKVEVFKADFSAGKWDAASDRPAKGEAIFLSRSYSKCTRAHGDIEESFVYYTAHLDDVFDMTSCTTQDSILEWPWQCRLEELAWFFPPELVV